MTKPDEIASFSQFSVVLCMPKTLWLDLWAHFKVLDKSERNQKKENHLLTISKMMGTLVHVFELVSPQSAAFTHCQLPDLLISPHSFNPSGKLSLFQI